MLSVFHWQSADIQKVASIILRTYPGRRVTWQTMYLHYDPSTDTAVISEGDVDDE